MESGVDGGVGTDAEDVGNDDGETGGRATDPKPLPLKLLPAPKPLPPLKPPADGDPITGFVGIDTGGICGC